MTNGGLFTLIAPVKEADSKAHARADPNDGPPAFLPGAAERGRAERDFSWSGDYNRAHGT